MHDRRRIITAAALLVASPCYVFCGFSHICMCGHMQHPPFPLWHYANDFLWVTGYAIALVLCLRSNIPRWELVFGCTLFLILSRLLLDLFPLTVPISVLLMIVGIRGLWRPADHPTRKPRNVTPPARTPSGPEERNP